MIKIKMKTMVWLIAAVFLGLGIADDVSGSGVKKDTDQ